MNRTDSAKFLVISFIILSFLGCSGNKTEKKADQLQTMQVKTSTVVGTETKLLLDNLKENGNYVNSKFFPSLIKASIVKESLDKNILVIDIRSIKLFSEGHIKGAVNKKFEDLPVYFESGIKPFKYDKIILVCDDGQLSSYTTSLLRLMGYGNVYSMRWGMSGWNNKYAQAGWLRGVSGKFETRLENKEESKPETGGLPELKTGMASGSDIGAARFRKLFEEGTANILISADEVFSDPKKYFIINLERKDKFDDGHIPGAVRFKPEGTLGYIEEMAAIPADKPVVVYCGTGHNSGFATAYLRLFGYDAHTLHYGNNSFMYDKMVRERSTLSWLPFTKDDVNNFEVVK